MTYNCSSVVEVCVLVDVEVEVFVLVLVDVSVEVYRIVDVSADVVLFSPDMDFIIVKALLKYSNALSYSAL